MCLYISHHRDVIAMDYTPIFLTEPSGEALLISSLLENYVIARPRRHYNETLDVVTSVTVTKLIGLVSCGNRELKVCISERFHSLKSILAVHFVDLFLCGFVYFSGRFFYRTFGWLSGCSYLGACNIYLYGSMVLLMVFRLYQLPCIPTAI